MSFESKLYTKMGETVFEDLACFPDNEDEFKIMVYGMNNEVVYTDETLEAKVYGGREGSKDDSDIGLVFNGKTNTKESATKDDSGLDHLVYNRKKNMEESAAKEDIGLDDLVYSGEQKTKESTAKGDSGLDRGEDFSDSDISALFDKGLSLRQVLKAVMPPKVEYPEICFAKFTKELGDDCCNCSKCSP